MVCMKEHHNKIIVRSVHRSYYKWRNITQNPKGKERNILHITRTKRRKAHWIGHVLHRNWLLKHVTERKTKEEEEDARSYLKEDRIHWNLKQNALDRNLWRGHFGKGNGRVANRDYVTDELIKLTLHECSVIITLNVSQLPSKKLMTSHYISFSFVKSANRCETILILMVSNVK